MTRHLPILGLVAVLLVKLVLGVIVARQVPLWTGYHHEIDSYNIARLIVEEGRLPRSSDFPPGQFEIRQGSQPPLYGLLTAAVAGVWGASGRATMTMNPAPYCINGTEAIVGLETDTTYNPPYSGHARGGMALRLLNVGFGVMAVGLAYAAGRIAFPTRRSIALIAAALLAFEPYTLRLNSIIINDNLLLMVAAGHLLALAYLLRADKLRWWAVALVFVTVALSILTKINGWVTLVTAVIGVGYVFFRQAGGLRFSGRQWVALGGMVAALTLMIAGLVTFNIVQYGSFFGRYDDIGRSLNRIWDSRGRVIGSVPLTLRYTLDTYAAAIREVPLPGRWMRAYRLTGVLLLAVAAWGVGAATIRRDRAAREILLAAAALFSGALVLVLLRSGQTQVVMVVQSLIFAPLRYYAVGLPALMLMASYGLHALLPRPVAWVPGAVAAGGWLVLSGATAYYSVPGQLMRNHVIPNTLAAPLSEAPALVQADYAIREDVLNADLLLGTSRPLTQNLRGRLDLRGANGATFTCEFVPLRGIYPTPRWQPGQLIRQQMTVENCAAPMSAPVTVAFSWVAPDGTRTPQQQTTLNADLPTGPTCPSNLGVFGDELQLVAIRTPPEASRGKSYEPLVNWLVLAESLQAQRRQFTLVHTEQGTTYSCQGFADVHAGVNSTQQFGDLRRAIPRGQIIDADGCVIAIPPDAPTGVYNIDIRLLDANGDPLSILDGDGLRRDRLQLDTVTLR